MVIIKQTAFAIIRYQKVFFPTPPELDTLIGKIAINDLIKVYCEQPDLADRPSTAHVYPVRTVRVDLTRGSEAVFKGMNRLCHRGVRFAEKMGDRIKIVKNTTQATSDFLDLYNSFARAKGGVPKLSRRAFSPYLTVADVCTLYLDDRPTVGLVTVKDHGAGYALNMFAASRRFDGKADADACGHLNRYLHWWEMRNCLVEGFKVQDFGFLYGDPGHPFNQFKVAFGGDVIDLFCYTFARMGAMAKGAIEAYRRVGTSRLGGILGHY